MFWNLIAFILKCFSPAFHVSEFVLCDRIKNDNTCIFLCNKGDQTIQPPNDWYFNYLKKLREKKRSDRSQQTMGGVFAIAPKVELTKRGFGGTLNQITLLG